MKELSKRELLRKLIAHYTQVITDVKNETFGSLVSTGGRGTPGYGSAPLQRKATLLEIRSYVRHKACDSGVCLTAYRRHGMSIMHHDWVERHIPKKFGVKVGAFWLPTPNVAESKEEILKALQKRVDIMRWELFRFW